MTVYFEKVRYKRIDLRMSVSPNTAQIAVFLHILQLQSLAFLSRAARRWVAAQRALASLRCMSPNIANFRKLFFDWVENKGSVVVSFAAGLSTLLS